MDVSAFIKQCPVCARILHFSHEEINLIQCSCGSVLQRKEGVVTEKPFYTIQQPAAIIQPGTEGVWNGKAFTVLGRFRAWIEEAIYNYWTIRFGDETICYLGEGYGMYAIYEKAAAVPMLTPAVLAGLKTGVKKELYKGESFLLERNYACRKWELEGEAYLPECTATFRTFEFAAPDGRHLEAMLFGDSISTFHVFYTSAASLQLTNIRSWETVEKELRCSQCSKPNSIKTFPYAQSYACVHCGARYAAEEDGTFKLLRDQARIDIKPDITLGASATLKEIRYEVIGYALKEESNVGRAQWKEYTLFNPQEGFAFLSEYNGNWMCARERGDAPVLERDGVTEFTHDNEPFQLFNRYGYETVNAAGEFPYNLFNDDDKTVREFISPPEIWIQEWSNREGIIWFQGEHMSRRELQAAFGEALVMPYKVGVGAVEPKGYVSAYKIAGVAFVAALVLVFAHIISSMTLQNRVILEQRYSFDSLSTVSVVTEKFQLDKWRSNLQFDIKAPVENSWFELNVTLVNAATGTEYTIEKGIEYYHGYSEGEYWAEGTTRQKAYLGSIPAGTYYLQISGTREMPYGSYSAASYKRPDGFNLKVTYDTPNDRNLTVCLIVLLIVPFVQYLIVQHHEQSRWSNSPFSPGES